MSNLRASSLEKKLVLNINPSKKNGEGEHRGQLLCDNNGWKHILDEMTHLSSTFSLNLACPFCTPTFTSRFLIPYFFVQTTEEQCLTLMYIVYANTSNNTPFCTHVSSYMVWSVQLWLMMCLVFNHEETRQSNCLTLTTIIWTLGKWGANSEELVMLEANIPRSWAISSELQKAASVQKNLVIYISISKLDTIKESDICPWVSNWPHNMTHFVQDLNRDLKCILIITSIFAIIAFANVVYYHLSLHQHTLATRET